jgi:hypothetical protein
LRERKYDERTKTLTARRFTPILFGPVVFATPRERAKKKRERKETAVKSLICRKTRTMVVSGTQ